MSWGVGGQGQCRYHFQISSHEKAREVPSPCPTGAGLLRPGLRPTAMPGGEQPRAVPPVSRLQHESFSQDVKQHQERLSLKDLSLTTSSVPSASLLSQATRRADSPRQGALARQQYDKNTLLHFYVHPSANLRVQVLDLCSPCPYTHSVTHHSHTRLCVPQHTRTGMGVCMHTCAQTHRKRQAGSKAESIINPPRGKHSSRYCGKFPAAYGRSSLT